VYNSGYRLCRHEADALDLTQATLLKAWEGLPRFDARSGLFTWLYRIAVNVALSHRRRRRPPLSLDAPGDNGRMREPAANAAETDVSRTVEQDELHARLAAALAELDDEYRAAVVLRDVEGLNYATIGEILEVPEGTVKSRIYRGRMLLRERLAARQVTLDAG